MRRDRSTTLLQRACRRIFDLFDNETGLTATEYALLLAVIVPASVACFNELGRATGAAASDGQVVVTGETGSSGHDDSGGAAPPTGH